MNNRPRITARAYDWKSGTNAIPGVGVILQRRVAAHLTEREARKFADLLHDLADELAASRQGAPQPAKAPPEPQPRYSTRSSSLEAADGTPEEPLTSTIAENE